MPKTSGFHSAKQIFSANSWARILSDHKVTYFAPCGEGEYRQGLMPLGIFLFNNKLLLFYEDTLEHYGTTEQF